MFHCMALTDPLNQNQSFVFVLLEQIASDGAHLSYRRKMLLRSSLTCSSSSVTSSLETREISSTTLCCIARHVRFSSFRGWHTNTKVELMDKQTENTPAEKRDCRELNPFTALSEYEIINCT